MPRQLKTNFNKNLNFHVVYEIKLNEGGSFHVGLTDRQVTTRTRENQNKDSQFG